MVNGAKSLRKAPSDVLGKDSSIQRCTVHKQRNGLEHLAKGERPWVSPRVSQVDASTGAIVARNDLHKLVEEIRPINPSAARSLEEGLEETLTVQRLELPERLRISLRNTNMIDSGNIGVQDRARNVKRGCDGLQVERWPAGQLDTERHFHRINRCGHMDVPIAALENYRAQEKTTERSKYNGRHCRNRQLRSTKNGAIHAIGPLPRDTNCVPMPLPHQSPSWPGLPCGDQSTCSAENHSSLSSL